MSDDADKLHEIVEAATEEAASTPPPPEVPPGYDPDVAEIVRREVEQINRTKLHLPGNFDDLPLPIRNRLFGQVEAALIPEPDLGWITGHEFLEPPKATEWLIQDLITSSADGGRVLVAGPEKSFKSLFATGCLVAVASGKPLFGYEPWSVPEPGNVLAFMGEGGREWNRSRVIRLMDGLGFTTEEKLATVDRLEMATVPLTPPERFALKLEKQLGAKPRKLVIVDSLYVFGGTTERSQLAAMGTLLVKWAELTERAGATLMVVDHFRKGTTALELSSVSGVGASQWAQAWSLMKAKYDADSDSTVIIVKTGARQSAGGVYKITITGVMAGPMRTAAAPTVESDAEEDEDDDRSGGSGSTSKPKPTPDELRLDALVSFNMHCSETREWMRVTEVKKKWKADDSIIDYIADRPHVAVRESRSGKSTWMYAVDETGEVPDPPSQAVVEVKGPAARDGD